VTTASEAARHLDRVEAEPSHADEMATRVFELSGLADEERRTLGGAAADAGVTLAFGESGVLLAGSPAELKRLRRAVEDSSRRLARLLETVCNPKR
jgi:dihydropteroate synthase